MNADTKLWIRRQHERRSDHGVAAAMGAAVAARNGFMLQDTVMENAMITMLRMPHCRLVPRHEIRPAFGLSTSDSNVVIRSDKLLTACLRSFTSPAAYSTPATPTTLDSSPP